MRLPNKSALITALFSTLLTSITLFPLATYAQSAPPPKAKNVVLVHGAWADGSSWAKVIPILQAAGLHVTSVQNPLTSLSDDVAATRRALALQDGPTVLVGHSYAGSVISEAGTDRKVISLVYVAARAPDAGEDFAQLATTFPTMPVRAGALNHDGFVSLTEEAYVKYFAGDLPSEEARALYATQQPIAKDLFNGKTSAAAWHTKPSWYAVSRQDQTTNPDFERFLAKRMHATTVELDSSHLSPVSHPEEIAEMILTAAGVEPASRLPQPSSSNSAMVSMEPFTVNLQQEKNDKQHYVLQTMLTIEVPDEAQADLISKSMAQFRSRLLLLLSGKRLSEISTVEGKKNLVNEMITALNKPLKSSALPQRVSNIFITSFITQAE